jgi:hypothetical protein
MRIILVVVLSLSLFSSASFADNPKILPEGTKVTVEKPGSETPLEFSIQEQTHFIISRSQLDMANAVRDANKELQKVLVGCEEALLAEKNRDRSSTWASALKWTGVGLAIAGAFYLGTKVQ